MKENQLAILKEGIEEWNRWRRQMPNRKIDLSGADLSDAVLRKAVFKGIDLTGALLQGADLHGADLSDAVLKGADLSGAILRKADLSRAVLSKANLSGIVLHGAVLSDAVLNDTDLSGAVLSDAILSGTDLSGAILRYAVLRRANLHRANLSGTNLTKSNLENANLTNCRINQTVLGLTNLGTCKGLDTIIVGGECVIDFQTLRDSKTIPKDFLFKIGLPEIFINYLPDFYDESPLRLHPVFLSHSKEDKEFAEKLYNSLIQNRVHVWYDERKLLPGDEIYESVSEGINVYDKMIIICSQSSLENSLWVKKELNEAFKKEKNYQKEHGKKINTIIPITIDDYVFNGWNSSATAQLFRYKIADMKNWQNEEVFNKGVQKVIKALDAGRKNFKPPTFH